eukprot:scaffold176470_cov18-Tisochrysis_lutea.AAC.1
MQQAREASKELVRMRADLRKRPGEFQVPTNKLQKVGSMLDPIMLAEWQKYSYERNIFVSKCNEQR